MPIGAVKTEIPVNTILNFHDLNVGWKLDAK